MAVALGAMAAVWGVVMALSPVLQIRRMWLTRSARDVSIGYFLVLIPGFALWVGYGVVSHNPVIAIPNSVAAVVALCLIAVAARLRRGNR
jgi:MtN3 and saliva related transmembrane protein